MARQEFRRSRMFHIDHEDHRSERQLWVYIITESVREKTTLNKLNFGRLLGLAQLLASFKHWHYGPHGREKLPFAPGKKSFSRFSQESTRKSQIRNFSLSVNRDFFSWVFGDFFLGSPKPGFFWVFFPVLSPGVFFSMFFGNFFLGPPMPGFLQVFFPVLYQSGRVMWCVEGGLEWRMTSSFFFSLKSFQPTLNESHDLSKSTRLSWFVTATLSKTTTITASTTTSLTASSLALPRRRRMLDGGVGHMDRRRLRLQPRRYFFFSLLFFFFTLILDYA